MRTCLPWFVQLTWGFPQTIAGAVVRLFAKGSSAAKFRTALVYEWSLESGLSLGPFVFVPVRCSQQLLVHEYGHTIQSLLLGPLYVPLVVVPSLVWAGLPWLHRWRKARHISYYALPIERWANWLGERVTGEKSMGQAFID